MKSGVFPPFREDSNPFYISFLYPQSVSFASFFVRAQFIEPAISPNSGVRG